jgi:hypothetical protein
MVGRGGLYPVDINAEDELNIVTLERLERRLGEESSALRLDMKDVRADIKDLRAEMLDRNANMLRWLLGFFVAQTAALGALLAALR